MNEIKKRGRQPLFGRAMTPAERRQRHDASKREKAVANMGAFERSLPTIDDAPMMDMTGALTRKQVLAAIADLGMRALVEAQMDEDEAACERAAEGELDEDDE
jgi:hypothetical protein